MADRAKNTTSKTIRGLFLVGLPAIAIWSPAMEQDEPKNLLVFWSWLYVPLGLMILAVNYLATVDSSDREFLTELYKSSKFEKITGFILGAVWTAGAVWLGWTLTGCLLAFGWLLGPLLGALSADAAKRRLAEIESEPARRGISCRA